ncbi:ArsC/Spx/MgsR family protein [Chitinibacter sp. ZOR0017]|uniref:ArsC/Spx/MgsR family protein n=1 Tax=Chitinibacter sp. ZOR0017 TaxID=1339254 RepID=UPI00064831F9|nr:ArsC/Spx/MgsR family protein [Chitinibacter sp. ZOR0017]
MQLLHNPRCSKSREALAALEAAGQQPQVRLYLQEPLSAAEVGSLLAQLGLPALGLVRQKEALWAELTRDGVPDEAGIIALLAAHPKLIERPVLIHQGRAAIGRPLGQILALLD